MSTFANMIFLPFVSCGSHDWSAWATLKNWQLNDRAPQNDVDRWDQIAIQLSTVSPQAKNVQQQADYLFYFYRFSIDMICQTKNRYLQNCGLNTTTIV